jgi:hypothetical protein
MGRTAKHKQQQKSKKRNLPPGIEPEAIREAFKQFLKSGGARNVVLFDYKQMRSLCTAFIGHMITHVREESNTFEKERLIHATAELFDILKTKYEIPVMDSAVLLLACGMELLNRCDEEEAGFLKRIHDEGL